MSQKQTNIIGDFLNKLFMAETFSFREKRLVFFAKSGNDPEDQEKKEYTKPTSGEPLTDLDELIKQVPPKAIEDIKRTMDSSPIRLVGRSREERFEEMLRDYLDKNPPREGYHEEGYFKMRDEWNQQRKELASLDDEIGQMIRGEKNFSFLAAGDKVLTNSQQYLVAAKRLKVKVGEEELKNLTNKEMAKQISDYRYDLQQQRERLRQEIIDQMDSDLSNRVRFLQKLWDNPPLGYQHKQKSAFTNLDYLEKKIEATHKLAKLSPILRRREFNSRKQQRFFAQLDIKEEVDDLDLRQNIDNQLRTLEIESYDFLEDAKAGPEHPDVLMAQLNRKGKKRDEVIAFVTKETNQKKDEYLKGLNRVRKLAEVSELLRDEKGEFTIEMPDGTKKPASQREKNLYEIDKSIKYLEDYADPTKVAARLDGVIQNVRDSITDAGQETNSKERSNKLFLAKDQLEAFKKELTDYPDRLRDEYQKIENGIKDFENQFVSRSKAVREREIVWMSFYDIGRIWQTMKEWSERRTSRRSDETVGKVGAKLFEYDVWPFKTLANEYNKKKESAEVDEVNKYKESYDNKDAWDIADIMGKTTNKDELKACIILLSDRGRLRWDDTRLWRGLNMWQKKVWFDTKNSDRETSDLIRLQDKMHKAIGYIWDFDSYFTWKTNNDSNYDSSKKKFEGEANNVAELPGGGLTKALSDMLRQHQEGKKKGIDTRINPHKYEEYVQYCVERGKMSPEGKLYFLIQGFASGIIPWERVPQFDSQKLNDYPVLEILASLTPRGERPTFRDVQEWAKFDGGTYKPAAEFNTWYWTWAMHRSKVLQRVDKSFSQGNRLDHDDATGMLAFAHDQTIESTLHKGASNEARLPSTGYQNATVAYLQYLDNAALNGQSFGDKQFMRDQVMRTVKAFFRFDSISDSRMYRSKGGQYFRFSEGMLKEGPRSNGYYVHAGDNNSTKFYIDKTRKYIRQIDEEVMDTLMSKTALVGRDQKEEKEKVAIFVNRLKNKYGNNVFGEGEPEPTSLDDLYLATGRIMDTIIAQNPDRIDRMLIYINQELVRDEENGIIKKGEVDKHKVTKHLENVNKLMEQDPDIKGDKEHKLYR